jgi:hypothetical protein
MALLYECLLLCAHRVLDSADIFRDRDLSPTTIAVLEVCKKKSAESTNSAPGLSACALKRRLCCFCCFFAQ